jgi:hypothetical protein
VVFLFFLYLRADAKIIPKFEVVSACFSCGFPDFNAPLIWGGLISLWLYKENSKLLDWKLYLLYIFPLSSTHLWLRCSNFFNDSRNILVVVLRIGNRKSQRLISTPTYPAIYDITPCSPANTNRRFGGTYMANILRFEAETKQRDQNVEGSNLSLAYSSTLKMEPVCCPGISVDLQPTIRHDILFGRTLNV